MLPSNITSTTPPLGAQHSPPDRSEGAAGIAAARPASPPSAPLPSYWRAASARQPARAYTSQAKPAIQSMPATVTPTESAPAVAAHPGPAFREGLSARESALSPGSASRAQRAPLAPSPSLVEEGTIFDPGFVLPPELEAGEPPEARGLARDEVRLMVSSRNGEQIVHAAFRRLPEFLAPGDLLVINTSGTLNAALPATRADGTPLELHLSTHLPADLWIVEVRRPDGVATQPFLTARAGETLTLPAGGAVTLHVPYHHDRQQHDTGAGAARLWIATLDLPDPLHTYLTAHGFPIRYGYVKDRWPLSYYQTVYATEPGSAEMPSAGRAFSHELLTALAARGIGIAPVILHTGVASLESHEPPYEEYFRVGAETARAVNAARAAANMVVAVGTTVVRALETVTDGRGVTHPGDGWTSLVITPARGIRAVEGLLTGLHEPRSSHLAMLEALAGPAHLARTYAEALRERYLWHEFGDLHLLLP